MDIVLPAVGDDIIAAQEAGTKADFVMDDLSAAADLILSADRAPPDGHTSVQSGSKRASS